MEANTISPQKFRPVIFSGPMVRAILEGRKTQTRRVIKPEIDSDILDSKHPAHSPFQGADGIWRWMSGVVSRGENDRRCPYGVAGDRLWVRESFVIDHYDFIPHGPMPKECPDYILDEHIYYAATNQAGIPEYDGPIPWRPSIYMPRWASRITLEITKVRVDRLQEISEEDAKAEGVGHGFVMNTGWPDYQHIEKSGHCTLTQDSARMSYATLWDSINGKSAWEKNPWVWVIDFCRVTEEKV